MGTETSSINELAAEFVGLTRKKRQHEKAITDINERLDEIKGPLVAANTALMEALAADGKKAERSIKIEGGGTIYFRDDRYASPEAGAEEEVFAWLDAHGYGHIARRQTNAKTFGGIYAEMLSNAGAAMRAGEKPQELPPKVKFTEMTIPILRDA